MKKLSLTEILASALTPKLKKQTIKLVKGGAASGGDNHINPVGLGG